MFLPEGGREPLPLPNQARHHEASEQQDGSVPQGGEPDEPPQGQDEPSAGQVPRQHQEAPKLTGPGKGISGGRTSGVCWFVGGYIQALPLIVCLINSWELTKLSVVCP